MKACALAIFSAGVYMCAYMCLFILIIWTVVGSLYLDEHGCETRRRL